MFAWSKLCITGTTTSVTVQLCNGFSAAGTFLSGGNIHVGLICCVAMHCREAQGHQQEVDQLLKDRRMAIVQLQEILALAKSMRLT